MLKESIILLWYMSRVLRRVIISNFLPRRNDLIGLVNTVKEAAEFEKL
jgi:hypothetical protein